MRNIHPDEPDFRDVLIPDKLDTVKALNFYRLHATDEQIREWADAWCERFGVVGSLAHQTPGTLKTFASLWRMRERGYTMSDAEQENVTAGLSALVKRPKYSSPKPKAAPARVKVGSEVVGKLEAYVDDVVQGKITSSRAPGLAETRKDVEELRAECEKRLAALALESEFYDRAVFKAAKSAYTTVLKSLEAVSDKIKTERSRVVKKRTKPPAVVSKNVRYLKEFQKIEGQRPEKMVGWKKAYVYDTEHRKLKVFQATGEGFTFTGTTLKNIDMEHSFSKTIRKPELLFAEPMTMSALNKFYASVKAVDSTVTGRFDEHHIILCIN